MQTSSGKSTIHVYKGCDSHCLKLLTMASLEPRVLSQIVRDGLGTLVFGFGYRAGILDRFIQTRQPCSAEELAKQAGNVYFSLQI